MSALAWLGRMTKAEMKEGKPFLTFLVTGPEIDKVKERVSKVVSEKVVALAKAAKIFLAPSHDTPLVLAKSVFGSMDAEGHTWIEFEVDQADPLAMKVYKGYETGEWTPTVSLGAEKVMRTQSFEMGKTITEIADLDETKTVHIALAFPGRECYPLAGITQAIRKALSADASELKKRFWPEASIQKAMGGPDGNGWPPPPTFAERWTAQEIQEDLPDMMDILRWTIEDTVSPYTSGTVQEKRALVLKSVGEFLDVVLGTIDDSQGASKTIGAPAEGIAKTEPLPAPGAVSGTLPAPEAPPAPASQATAPPQEPQDGGESPELEKAMKALTDTVNGFTGTLSEVKGKLEALEGKIQKTEPPPTPEPEGPTTDPATAPHSGVGLTEPAAGVDSDAKKSLQEEESRLRKAISEATDASIKAKLTNEHGTVITRIQRMEMGY